MISVAVIMTCHNRRETTIRSLRSLLSEPCSSIDLRVFLVDDGSEDGTADAISLEFPDVNLIRGDGTLYWAGGMRLAWERSRADGTHDYCLWLNDDVALDPGALKGAIELAEATQKRAGTLSAFVGGLRDPDSGKLNYGGVRRASRWRALYFELVAPTTSPEPADTCNGNFLLVPEGIVNVVGGIDPAFTHALGDYDYGFRVSLARFQVLALPGSVGVCSRNPVPDRERILALSVLGRWKRMTGPKLYPLCDWYHYTSRHTGVMWPVFFIRPYVEVLFPRFFNTLH